MFDDAFTACTNGTNGITIFGLMSPDVDPEVFAREINRRLVMLVCPPEPPNTSLLLDELIKDIYEHTCGGRYACNRIGRDIHLQTNHA